MEELEKTPDLRPGWIKRGKKKVKLWGRDLQPKGEEHTKAKGEKITTSWGTDNREKRNRERAF